MTSASALMFAVVLTLLFAAYQRWRTEPDIEPDDYEEVEEWEEWDDDGEVVVVEVEVVEVWEED